MLDEELDAGDVDALDDVDPDDSLDFDVVDESLPPEELDEADDSDFEPEPESDDELESDPESLELDGVVVDLAPRLSFLKNPLPLNVTPTG